MSQFWPEQAAAASPVRRWFSPGELVLLNPYFAVGLSGGEQYLPGLMSMPSMRRIPTVRRSDGTTGLHVFRYLSSAAGAPLTRSVRLEAESESYVSGLYAGSDNGGAVLPTGYMLATNVNPVWLDAS